MANNKVKSVFALVVVFAAMLSAASLDFEDSQMELNDYCQMVKAWDLDGRANIAPQDRTGHPNYKEINCN